MTSRRQAKYLQQFRYFAAPLRSHLLSLFL
jgi:hypothetical protein